MTETADRLARLIATVPPRLVGLSDSDVSSRPAAGRWSRKEILGHLIDSASNHHQRLVRAALSPNLTFPSYEQEAWVAAQNYASGQWPDVVNLWVLLNRHLVHVMRNYPLEAWQRECRIGDGDPVTVSALAGGYLDHLEHHLQQIFAQ
jgi:hypothetical protein